MAHRPTENTARLVVVSASAQMMARVLHLAFNLVSTLAIVRYLSPDRYGAYVLVMTMTVLVGLVADFGLAGLAVREIRGAGANEDQIIGTVVAIRLGLGVIAIGLAQIALTLMHESRMVHIATAVASTVCLADALLATIVVVFQVRLVQHYEAFIRIVMEGIETAIILVLVTHRASLVLLVAPPVLGSAIGAVLAYVVARRRYGLSMQVTGSRAVRLLVQAIPIGPALFIGVVYLKLDNIVLASLRPQRDVGLYGSAYQPIEYLFLATAVLIGVIFPLLSAAYGRTDHETFVRLYKRGTEALVIVTLGVPVVMLFVAEPLVKLTFGAAYAPAAQALRVLAFALVMMTVNAWQSIVLLAGGLQSLTLKYNAVALIVAVVLCVTFVRLFGMVGAAFSALGTAVFVLFASTSAVRRHLNAKLDGARLARIGLAAAVAIGVGELAAAAGAPWVLLGIGAGLVYLMALGCLRLHRGFAEALA